jgi:hypothetical protein
MSFKLEIKFTVYNWRIVKDYEYVGNEHLWRYFYMNSGLSTNFMDSPRTYTPLAILLDSAVNVLALWYALCIAMLFQ